LILEEGVLKGYLIYSLFVSALIYPIYGHWVWGGGWLSKFPFGLGHLDFAGSGVVHIIGGMVGLAGAVVLGPRFGKYSKDGTPRAIPGHSLTLAALGLFILWFGWFGFNSGSTLSAHELRISVVAVNTNLAAAAGALFAFSGHRSFSCSRLGFWFRLCPFQDDGPCLWHQSIARGRIARIGRSRTWSSCLF